MKVYCKYTKMLTTDELTEHPSNPNTHPPEQIKLLATIIEKHGWRRPIVASNRTGENVIIKGHGRFEAAQLLGLKELPVDIQEYESEKHELEDLVADNRLAELVDVDMDKLREAFENVDTTHFETGYTDGEIENIINNMEIEKDDLVLDREVDVDPKEASGQKSMILHYMKDEAETLSPILGSLQSIYNCRNISGTVLTLLKNYCHD